MTGRVRKQLKTKTTKDARRYAQALPMPPYGICLSVCLSRSCIVSKRLKIRP